MWNVFRAELTKLRRPSLSLSTIAAVTFVVGLVTSLLFLLVDSPEGNGERGVEEEGHEEKKSEVKKEEKAHV